MQERFSLRAAVYLILEKDDQFLLSRRFNTGWADGEYSLIAGHLDGAEMINDAMSREAFEEANVTIEPEDLNVVHTMHRNSNVEYIDFFLVASKWQGTPQIGEPDKCDDMRWFPKDDLPKNLLPYIRQAFDCYRDGVTFSEFGWDKK